MTETATTPIRIERTQRARAQPATPPSFGTVFTDHMFLADHVEGTWRDPRIVPYGPLSLDPAAAGLHYGQLMFEGLKAFRGDDGRVRIFRLDRHCRRMAEGAPALCMPSPDQRLMADGIKALVALDSGWVPTGRGTALYLRPTLIATEAFLGVRPARQYQLFVIACPVGAYYAEGFGPLRIHIEDHYVRAAQGGLGAVKAAANYAASLRAAEEAKARGYAQVLWTDAISHTALEEVGTMNLFVQIGDEVITPPLEGTLLGGVTRDSILTLLRRWGMDARERRITVDELVGAQRSGTLREVFGCGTGAVISPVGELGWKGEPLVVADGKPGPLSRRLFEAITAIQSGAAPDTDGWMVQIG